MNMFKNKPIMRCKSLFGEEQKLQQQCSHWNAPPVKTNEDLLCVLLVVRKW